MEYKKDEERETLQVQMFGGFSMTWKGTRLAGASKTRESQFVYLMQLLLHYREKGVSRELLEEVLFGEREIDNIHNAMRSVIYNAKKKLQKACLPDVSYIVQKKGIYYWTEKIAVSEDSARFEELIQKAEKEEHSRTKLRYLLEACYLYRGEFLPQQAAVIWAAQEARRFRQMFFGAVEEAAELLRERQDWPCLKKLGTHAAAVSPFADWEVLIMEAYTSMGQYEEARKLYDDTVELYVQEQGVRPDGRLEKLLERLGKQMNHQYALLDAIQEDLAEGTEVREGGYLCAYPEFRGIYHMVKRIMERGGQSVYLMLCTIMDSRGRPMKEGTILEELAERLEVSICHSVRRGDTVCRYGRGQYLMLLVNTTRENCQAVQRRINEKFVIGRQRIGVKYHVNSVLCPIEE